MKESMAEALKVVQAVLPSTYPAAETLKNGASAGSGIDTRSYDEALIELQLGSLTSPDTVTVTVEEHTSDAAASSGSITSASFGAKNSASTPGMYVGRMKLKNRERYIWVKSVTTGTNDKLFSVSVILGKSEKGPLSQDNTVAFDI